MSSSSGGNSNGGEIHKTTLKGHKASVLCLAHSSDLGVSTRTTSFIVPSCLFSGSEDGTARLWDLRSSARAALCLLVPKEGSQDVTSVAFAPPNDTNADLSRSPFARNYLVYLSVGNCVYGYDLRSAAAPIVREFTHDLTPILENEEEVNQISLSLGRSNNQALQLAAADDGGVVRVADCHEPSSAARRRRVLHHDPDGLAMVTCTEFRPKTKGTDLASGGTDCTVNFWDVTRPRRASATFQISNDNAGANQVCNPPMVHSLSWSPSGRLLAAGLGDGTCTVLRIGGDRRTLTEVARLREGHDAAVASLVFPDFQSLQNHSQHVALHDRLLVSAGNDGSIFFWDLGAEVAGYGAVDPATLFASEMTRADPNVASLQENMDGLSLSNDSKILFGIPHQLKANWLCSSRNTDPPSLFVADTTDDITAYTFPFRK